MGDSAAAVTGLAVGAAFVVLFALVFNNASVLPQKPSYATIVIPEGASLASLEKSYKPSYARLFIGMNNTIRWVNQDVVPHSIIADSNFDPDLGTGTDKPNMVLLAPGQSFEYTFKNIGRHDYHGEPGPHLRGLIEVYPELEKEMYVNISVEGLKSTYKVGEPVTFTVVAGGYGSRCDSFEARIEDKVAPEFGYSVGSIPGCTYPESFNDFRQSFQIGPESQVFSPIYINQTGTYLLTVSYGPVQFTQMQDTVEIEFTVVG